jgi:hypothetical protein
VPNRKPGFGTPAAFCEPNGCDQQHHLADGRRRHSVSEAANAAAALDARVIAVARVSVVLRPMPVVGVGYGVLPRLWGEAHGVVGDVGAGTVPLALSGAAVGEVDDDLELVLLMLAVAA